MSKQVLSIIVPVYNTEKYLTKCIDSILNQTFSDFELILVNNGSTDKSSEILEQYRNKDQRIIVLNSDEKGIGVARNAGLKIASGKYVGFVDSDDWIDSQMYEYLIRIIEESSAELSCCSFAEIKKEQKQEAILNELPGIMSSEEFILHTYDRPGTVLPAVWNKIFIRESIAELFDEKIKCDEDAKFLIHYCMKIRKVAYTDKVFYYYNRRLESSTMSNIKVFNYGLSARRQLCEELVYFSKDAQQVAEKHFLDRCCLGLSVSKNGKGSAEYQIAKSEFQDYLKKNIIRIQKNRVINYKLRCVIVYWMIRSLF